MEKYWCVDCLHYYECTFPGKERSHVPKTCKIFEYDDGTHKTL